ncbi:hypothetical protein ACXR2W_07515 [Leucobacter sp. HY1908]
MSAREFGEAARVIEGELLLCWYYFKPAELLKTLDVITGNAVALGSTTQMVQSFLLGAASLSRRQVGEMNALLQSNRLRARLFVQLGKMLWFRLQGRPVQGLLAGQDIELHKLGPVSIHDTSRGWRAFGAVQHAITAMLAGDFQLAIGKFSEAQSLPLAPELGFLHRDAYVRAAMIHAILGENDTSRSLLDRAREIPRTSSWAEGILDTSEAIVCALLETRNSRRAGQMLESISTRELGELWPFYAWAWYIVLTRSARFSDAARRLEEISAMPFPAHPGEGLSGSIISLLSAQLALRDGDLQRAQQLIELADPEYVGTKLSHAEMLHRAGNRAEASAIVECLEREVRGLSWLERQREALMSDETETFADNSLTERQLLLLHYLETDSTDELICRDFGLERQDLDVEIVSLQQLLRAHEVRVTL